MASVRTKIRRLKEMPLRAAMKKIAGKAVQEARFAYRQYRIRLSPIALAPEQFRRFMPACAFPAEPAKREEYVRRLRAEGMDEGIIRDADRICEHIFDLLGSGEVRLGSRLPWHEDFKTGFRWEKKFYKRIKLVDPGHAADVKIPWELSRFQHFFTLGKAYWLTENEKYALEFQMQLEDWISENPVEMSVNWTCAMDVAIRAANWIFAVPFFRGSPSLSPSFWERFHASLYLHGVFIRSNLENKGEHTGNHYAADLAGLVALGLYFGNFHVPVKQRKTTPPPEWLSFGKSEMEKELFVQVNADGTNYEASTSYHRLVAEMFLITTIWCGQNGIHFSERYVHRLEKMHEFLLGVMKPDGLTPLIGDADDGRYLIASRYGDWVRNDFRHLLAVAGEWFDRDDFRAAGASSREDALWVAGGWKPASKDGSVAPKSAAYPNGGYYVLRGPEAYCLIRCGELSFHGHGAHSHNDQLSFVLNVKGRDVLVDPGTYVYSADYRARNRFRSTAVHNTLQVYGLEQNEMDEDVLFLLREQTFAECFGFAERYFCGSHHGYLAKAGVIHRREIVLEGAGLSVMDTLKGTGPDFPPEAFVSWMLAPGTGMTGSGGTWMLETGVCRVTFTFAGAETAELEDAWVSTGYGTRVPSRMLRVHTKQGFLKTNIRWDEK